MTRRHSRLGALVLARLDSERLPGKALLTVEGKPLLAYTVERVLAADGIDDVVLATTDREIDEPLKGFAKEMNVGIFRGAAEDVSGRVVTCIREWGLDAFARVNGDSPLLDYQLLSMAITEFRTGRHDIVTNVLRRTYPPGMSVEILDAETFTEGYARMSEPRHFEHVTKFFYENPDRYRIHNIESQHPQWGRIQAAVDTEEDLARLRRVVGRMKGEHLRYTGDEVVRLLQEDADRTSPESG